LNEWMDELMVAAGKTSSEVTIVPPTEDESRN
jgi:hypothetical protein